MKTKLGILITALVLSAPAHLQAIPAWSRQNDTSCSSCHATPTWQLNKAGLTFLANGHRNEAFTVDKSEQTINNYLSFIWKFRAWNDQPDEARTALSVTQKPKTNFEQHSFAIYTGGPISERLSYFTEIYLSENTGSTSGSNIVQGDASRKKLAEAFLQYNHPLDEAGDTFLAARVGEILPELLHVFGIGARSAEQRTTMFNDSLAGNSNAYKPFSRQQGGDVTLVNEKYKVAVGLVNGSDTSTTNSIDADNHKDLFYSAFVNLDDNYSGIGVFRYDGKFTNYTVKQDYSTAILFKNDFNRTIYVGRYMQDNWRLVGAFMIGEETMNAAGATTKNQGYYVLADYNFNDNLGVYARYDRLDPNTDLGRNEVTMALIGINGLFYQSEKSAARWQVEYTVKNTFQGGTISAAGTTKYTDNRLYAQITWGF